MKQVELGRARTDRDGCRRYMAQAISFDTRAHLLTTDIEDNWETNVRELWLSNRLRLREELVHHYGNDEHERKIDDFADLGPAPWSIVDLHNDFTAQIRTAFVAGAYYPALVGAGALGERLLNQLVIRLRDDYADHPATTPVANVKSVSSWHLSITVLSAWGVLEPKTAKQFSRLARLRNRAVHYGEHLNNSDAREDALEVVKVVESIVEELFAPMGGPPRFIAGTSGHTFIALASEELPLIRRFYLPACVLVSPRFEMRPTPEMWFDVHDDETYQEQFPVLSDEEFADHRNNPRR